MSGVRRIVSNTGPLISLEKLNQGYDFIRRLYEKIVLPPSVLGEVAEGQFANPHTYLHHYGILDLIEIQEVPQPVQLPEAERLHEGEREAIQLASELQLPLLIEETVGRRVARELGIPISGIAGQIIRAFRQEVITAAEERAKLGELFQAGRINRKIYEALAAVTPKA